MKSIWFDQLQISYFCKLNVLRYVIFTHSFTSIPPLLDLAWKLVPRLVKKLKKKSYLHRFTTLLYNTLGYDFRYIKHVIVVVLLFIPKQTTILAYLKWKSKCFSASWVQLQLESSSGGNGIFFSQFFFLSSRSSIGGLLHKPEMTSEWHR